MSHETLESRAARHAALGDPLRLAIIDELSLADRSPVELRRSLGVESNLLAHHLDALEAVGLIERFRSSGDGRRRYVRLLREALPSLVPGQRLRPARALFVCTHNSARSQLAAALWRQRTGAPATSAGTEPAERVHPGAVAAAERAGLDLTDAEPTLLDRTRRLPPIVVTVCDRAHEELDPDGAWLHWSIPDPVSSSRRKTFDTVVDVLRRRIDSVVVQSGPDPRSAP